jgi:hypothetical protein
MRAYTARGRPVSIAHSYVPPGTTVCLSPSAPGVIVVSDLDAGQIIARHRVKDTEERRPRSESRRDSTSLKARFICSCL